MNAQAVSAELSPSSFFFLQSGKLIYCFPTQQGLLHRLNELQHLLLQSLNTHDFGFEILLQ